MEASLAPLNYYLVQRKLLAGEKRKDKRKKAEGNETKWWKMVAEDDRQDEALEQLEKDGTKRRENLTPRLI